MKRPVSLLLAICVVLSLGLVPGAAIPPVQSAPEASYALQFDETNGPDSFTYQANDGVADSNVATVNLTVAAVNDAPVITEGASTAVTMSEDGSPTAFDLTLHATDPDVGDTLTWSITTPASHGTAAASGTGASKAIGYTPINNYNGSDSFVVQVADSSGGTDTITVNVTITPVADTYYVDNTNGSASDWNPGTTPALAFLTIGKGASKARAGDTVRVLAGTYAETVKPSYSGTAGHPVTFSAASVPGVTMTGLAGNSTNGGAFRLTAWSYIVVDGFNVTGTADYGIFVYGSNHMTIQNNHVSYSGSPVSGSTRTGIYISSTTDSIINGNTSDHNSSDGIRLVNGSNNNTVSNNISFGNASGYVRDATGINVLASNNNTIIHNIVYANEDTGLNFYTGSSYNLVVGNLTYGNGDHGIDSNAAPNNVFIGNTVHGNVTVGINLEGATSPGSGGATLINNISVDNGFLRLVGGGMSAGSPGNIQVDAQSLSGTTLDYNMFYLNSSTVQIIWGGTSYTSLAAFRAAVPGQETHGLQTNPLFASPAPIAERPPSVPFNVAINVGDYHLTAGSPAIDSANADAPNEPALDIEGNARVDDPATANAGAGTRTYDDRGAYEFQPPPNRAPVITEGESTSVTMSEDGSPTAFSLTLNATDADSDTLTWSISTAASHGTASAIGTGTSKAIGYIPTADYNGTDSFTVQVSDGNGGTDTITVSVTVGAVNDAPSFTKGADFTLPKDAGAKTYAGWATAITAGPANEAAQALSFTVTNNNHALFAMQPAVSPAGDLTFTPATSAIGTVTVTVVLTDDGGTANGGVDTSPAQTFTITFEALPQIMTLSLVRSADKKTWTAVAGDLTGGFVMDLDGSAASQYLDVRDVVANKTLKDGLYPFTVDQGSLPSGWLGYWAGRGVVEGATGWQGVMWEIIHGRQPIFYLKVAAGSYRLVGGLVYLTGSGEEYLEVDGAYLLGAYRYTASIADTVGGTSSLSIQLSFQAPYLPAAPAITITRDGEDVLVTWPPVTTDAHGNFTVVTEYVVYVSGQPYFNPAGVTPEHVDKTKYEYRYVGASNSLTNYYYIVRAVNIIGPSADSRRVGTFSFSLLPDSAP